MAKIDVLNIKGEVVETMELSDDIFGIEVNKTAMHMVVRNILSNKRQGTQSTLTRSEVRGGGRKPYRQKGTGRARQGSTRSPQWYKGGVVFAPKPRSYRFSVNKKVRRIALKSALSDKLALGNSIVIETLNLEAPLGNLKVDTKALIVTDGLNRNVYLSARNIQGVAAASAQNINVYDILKYEKFIVTKDAVNKIQEVYV